MSGHTQQRAVCLVRGANDGAERSDRAPERRGARRRGDAAGRATRARLVASEQTKRIPRGLADKPCWATRSVGSAAKD